MDGGQTCRLVNLNMNKTTKILQGCEDALVVL